MAQLSLTDQTSFETAQTETRPVSQVSPRTGLVGALTLCALLMAAFAFDMSALSASLVFLLITAFVMAVWEIAVERAHRHPETGMNYALQRPRTEVRAITRTKVIGLGATFAIIGVCYFTFSSYRDPSYEIYFLTAGLAAPVVWLFSPFYIAFTTARMTEPKDGLWHFGKWITCDFKDVDVARVKNYALAWAVKGFFLAFMVSIFPKIVNSVLSAELNEILSDPVICVLFLLQLTYLFDVTFGTIGYLMTFRVFNSHIRSANPYLSAWVFALICYPPFALMSEGGLLDYKSTTQSWSLWMADHPVLIMIWGAIMVVLMAIYAWATVIFGLRFSNLTHRGIITGGPYKYFKHPAYLTKNIMWWMAVLPFLSPTGSVEEAVRSCVLLGLVNGVYYCRARTEEKHLMSDPHYRAYSRWIGENGVLAKLFHRQKDNARTPSNRAL